ncbi:hypothetical protein P4O66_001152 [Electrophorus voltai]|uniref:Chromo domain-containing protein n=1 Tax=Electrophorus voltai TaxID=2609070 RepID=A0AAD8ZA38_9TELE|nr:hypothetical protein P4O66_001152 [Electrophorus voltai]
MFYVHEQEKKVDTKTLAGKPSILLGTLQTPTIGESAAGGFWGGSECGPGSDSAESYGPTLDYRDWYNGVQYSESDSAGFYDPTMNYDKGCVDSERKGEYSDISLWLDFESDPDEHPSVEEVLHRDPLSVGDTADSKSNEPPAPKAPPKAPPRACRSGASKLPRLLHSSSFVCTGPLEEVSLDDTPPQPIKYDSTPVYAVHHILDSRRRGGSVQYLVHWEGFGPEEQSWVPCCNVLDPGLLSDFHTRFLDKPAPHLWGCPCHLPVEDSHTGPESAMQARDHRGHPRALAIPDSLEGGYDTLTFMH